MITSRPLTHIFFAPYTPHISSQARHLSRWYQELTMSSKGEANVWSKNVYTLNGSPFDRYHYSQFCLLDRELTSGDRNGLLKACANAKQRAEILRQLIIEVGAPAYAVPFLLAYGELLIDHGDADVESLWRYWLFIERMLDGYNYTVDQLVEISVKSDQPGRKLWPKIWPHLQPVLVIGRRTLDRQ